MLALAFVLMQFMISAKAGLVNYVDGQANVRLHEQVPGGTLIETGPRSHVELLLNPGWHITASRRAPSIIHTVSRMALPGCTVHF